MSLYYVEEGRLSRLHWPLVLCTSIIGGLGVWNLASAGRGVPGNVWSAQLTWLVLGTVLIALSLLVDYRVLRSLAWPVFIFTVVLLVLVPIKGRVIMGAQRWLEFGPVRIQPSEFAKLTVILVLARYFGDNPPSERIVRKKKTGTVVVGFFRRSWASVVARYNRSLAVQPVRQASITARETGYRLKELAIPALLLFVPAGLIIKQPDLGTGLVTLAVGGSMILFGGVTTRTFVFLTTTGAGAAVLTWFYGLKPYQRSRVTTFLDPFGDAQGKGYHSIQSLIAVGSGQTWGKGWGNGTQNQLSFLPEQHTDFAFPVFAEEQGFAGAAVIVLLYLFLVFCALDIASKARDRFGAFLAFGAAALFFWHTFVNIGMVLGMLPVVGVPLLLMSYGGSSALLTMLAIGVLLNISLRRSNYSTA